MSGPRVAVIAHRPTSSCGGLDELRRVLTEHDVAELDWHEVPKSRKAPKQVARALEGGAELLVVWGGDGMVQRCVDAAAGSGVPLAVIPAGTANLFASNLGIPTDLRAAVDLAFRGTRRRLDVGVINGERFAVMAGAGFDALMIRDADRGMKSKVGRLAYVWTGARATRAPEVEARVRLDGTEWFRGPATCVLIGNVGKVMGGLQPFDGARPDDGWLDVGVTTASGVAQWARLLGRAAAGQAERSPFVRTARAKDIDVAFDRPLPYELDGGDRDPVDRLHITVEPGAIEVYVPATTG